MSTIVPLQIIFFTTMDDIYSLALSYVFFFWGGALSALLSDKISFIYNKSTPKKSYMYSMETLKT